MRDDATPLGPSIVLRPSAGLDYDGPDSEMLRGSVMKAVKIIGILFGIWVAIVVIFESLIGFMQPTSSDSVTITTVDADGNSFDRVLSGLDSGGQFYVAVNHWPRAWYRRLLENPEVRITRDDETRSYLAVRVSGEEAASVEAEYPRGMVVGFLMGFAPRYFIRLDPIDAGA